VESKVVKSMVFTEQKETQAQELETPNPIYLSLDQSQQANIERNRSKGQLHSNQMARLMAQQIRRSRSPTARDSNLESSPIKLKPPKL